jgi:Protein of unknown function (DUF3306)
MVERKVDDVRSDGFLSRWSRRKQDVLAGKPVAEPAPTHLPADKLGGLVQSGVLERNMPLDHNGKAQAATVNIANTSPQEVAAAPPPLTLDDASALTPASDFKPFMARSVSPEVKNAAMKKLFADPHYNVMDMMDTYVDDYSKPDPIPESMLRELVSAKFLRLFERDEEEGAMEGQPVAAVKASPLSAEVVELSDMPVQAASEGQPLVLPSPEATPPVILQAPTPRTAPPSAQPIPTIL